VWQQIFVLQTASNILAVIWLSIWNHAKYIDLFQININREHAVELNNPLPTEPLIFLKPTTAYIVEGQKIKVKAVALCKVI